MKKMKITEIEIKLFAANLLSSMPKLQMFALRHLRLGTEIPIFDILNFFCAPPLRVIFKCAIYIYIHLILDFSIAMATT